MPRRKQGGRGGAGTQIVKHSGKKGGGEKKPKGKKGSGKKKGAASDPLLGAGGDNAALRFADHVHTLEVRVRRMEVQESELATKLKAVRAVIKTSRREMEDFIHDNTPPLFKTGNKGDKVPADAQHNGGPKKDDDSIQDAEVITDPSRQLTHQPNESIVEE